MHRTVFLIFILLLLGCPETVSSQNMLPAKKSLYSPGNTVRLKNTMLKAKRGEKLVIGCIGGSITRGESSTRHERAYFYHIVKWWETHFPMAEIEFINAGIGATDSNIGVFRVYKHLLRYKPDFVIVEFAVNDGNTNEAAETLEGITRQVLMASNHPAMMLLFMCDVSNGQAPVSAQEWHSKIGLHYELPMISFGDAVWPEIQSGRIKSEAIFNDGLHPNDLGHKYAADFIISFLNQIFDSLDGYEPKPVSKLPAPLISDRFEKTVFLQAEDIEPFINNGWFVSREPRWKTAWISTATGSVVGFEIEGKEISILSALFNSAGIISVKVDDFPEMTFNAFTSLPPSPGALKIFQGDKTSKHKVVIKLIDKKDDKSNGHNFSLLAFMVTL